MADIDELYEKAKVKLEAESFQHGTPQDAIRGMCLEWLEWARTNDTKAVELLADAAKDTKGAYSAMENFARNKKRQRQLCKAGTAGGHGMCHGILRHRSGRGT